MSDDRFLPTALVGVERCGCITAAFVERRVSEADEAEEYRKEVHDFYTVMAETDREVRRMMVDEAKKSPHFLDCAHVEVKVKRIRADEVKHRDVIWAPEDGDWLKVDAMQVADDEIVLFRRERSEATFSCGHGVLLRVDGKGGG